MKEALPSSTTISHYRLIRKLGAGGMGEVYLADDARLDRKVAIKFLPPESIADEQAKKRLVREARAAARLDHPNICAIHEVGEADGLTFIVMQYIEGKTLASRLRKKPLKLNESLDIAVQVADALAEAHSHGIIHRDIKPQNIMLTSRGQAKVLDFGLAKVAKAELSTDSEAVTRSLLTEPGMIVGTVQYMSPEQVKGEKLDARSDIFSFGAVLYQMMSSHHPFAAETPAATISAILTREPLPLARYSRDVPAELERIVSKALRKDREERYQVIRDLALDLKSLKEEMEFEVKLERSLSPDLSSAAKLTTSGRHAKFDTAEDLAIKTSEIPAVPTLSSAEYIVSEIKRHKKSAALVAALLVVAVAAAIFFYFKPASALTERDTILLADFVNTTGDAVFDGTLKQALAVQLGQSPFLNIFSDERVRDALRFMGRSPDERVTRDIGREICQRHGLKALLAGSISGLGSHYVITLEAINTQTGDALAREQVEAESKEQVLKKLGETATKLREKLGESLATVQKFDAPIEQATTSSLEALKAYSLGVEQLLNGRYLEAVPLYKRAIELDPNFAIAYARLSIVYNNTRQFDLSAEASQRAYELRDRASERERFYIFEAYYRNNTREVDKQIEVLELWKRTYPRDWVAYNNLALRYNTNGQFEKAIGELREAIRLNRHLAPPRSNLAFAFIGLNRFDEAKQVLEEAAAEKLESTTMRGYRYDVAFVQGDASAMKQQVDWAKGRPDEYAAQNWQASRTEFSGQLRKAREFNDRAAELAKQGDFKEIAANLMAARAVRDATLGSCGQINETTAKALSIARTRLALTGGAEAFAICGQASQAQLLMDELSKRFPRDTLLNTVWLPLFRAQLEMHRGNAAQAIELLEPARRYDVVGVFWPQYLRGQAYLGLSKGEQAAAEFQKILDHRGWYPTSALYPLAHLGLARAAALAGDTAKSRKAYQDLFALWEDADTDIPILIEAKREHEKVK